MGSGIRIVIANVYSRVFGFGPTESIYDLMGKVEKPVMQRK